LEYVFFVPFRFTPDCGVAGRAAQAHPYGAPAPPLWEERRDREAWKVGFGRMTFDFPSLRLEPIRPHATDHGSFPYSIPQTPDPLFPPQFIFHSSFHFSFLAFQNISVFLNVSLPSNENAIFLHGRPLFLPIAPTTPGCTGLAVLPGNSTVWLRSRNRDFIDHS
jgi:hypothetical protein